MVCYRLLSEGAKRAIYILRDEGKCLIKATYIRQLTDLKVINCDSGVISDFEEQLSNVQVGYSIKKLKIKKLEYRIKYYIFPFLFTGSCSNYRNMRTINKRKENTTESNQFSDS